MPTLTQGQSFTDTAGRTGIVNFDTQIGAQLAPGATTISPVISTDIIQKNGTEPTLPGTIPTLSPQDFVAGLAPITPVTTTPVSPTAPGALSATTKNIGTIETQRSTLAQRLADAQNQLLGQGPEQLRLEQNAGISQSVQDINSLKEQIATKKAAFDQTQQNYRSGQILDQVSSGKIQQLEVQKAVELGGLSSLLLAKEGSLEAAKAEIDRTLKLEFDPIKQEIENTKTFLDLNYQDLSRADQQQANALRVQLDREARAASALQSQKSDLLKYALDNNIGADAYNKILMANSTAGIAEASKLVFDNIATNAGVESKVLATTDYKTLQGLAPAVKAINDYKAAVAKYGSYEQLNAKGSGELKSSYGDAIAAWKTLAGLGALSGADFGLAENVIPAPSLFTRNKKFTAQLDGALSRATYNAGNLINNLKTVFPKSSAGLDTILLHATNPGDAINDPLNLGISGGANLNPLGL